MIEALPAAGADPNARTNWGNAAPLHLAQSAAAVRALLAAGADLEAASRGGPTPLYVAVADGNREVIKALLEAGADPLSEIWKGDPRTPVELAGWDPQGGAGSPTALELLQAVKAAGQNCKLWNTKRYFQAATPESVTNCIEAGADPRARDSANRTPLHWGVAYSTDPAVLRALLEAAADVEARDNHGATPLHRALINARQLYNRMERGPHFTELVQILIDAGADVTAMNERWEETALEMATGYLYEGLPYAIFEALIKAAAAQNGPISIEELGETIAGMEFVWVPAGEFQMGPTSAEAGDGERAVTRVRISQGFWLGKYEVTQDEWQGVMGVNPSDFSRCGRCPVEQVSWDDVQEFIGRLNGQNGGNRYRLPTEAEWEYAARSGTAGDRYGNLEAIAWCDGNSTSGSQPVGQKAPNAWGVHDMLGNVNEWVQDWRGDYPGGSVADPQGPASGLERVVRGGSSSDSARYCRPSDRSFVMPGLRHSHRGFRLLRKGK